VVGGVDDGGAAVLEAIGDRALGMIDATGADAEVAEGEVGVVVEFFDGVGGLEVRGQHGEKRSTEERVHGGGKRRAGDVAEVRAVEAHSVAGRVDGGEERQTLDVIPMVVGEKQREVDGLPAASAMPLAELADAGAGVNQDELVGETKLEAGVLPP
jgi:hypothetical protein